MKQVKGFMGQAGQAELALSSSMAKNRSFKTLEQLNKVINWSRIEKILKKYYKVGISPEGADVYPVEFEDYSIGAYAPLMLFKCLLLQKWFRPSTI